MISQIIKHLSDKYISVILIVTVILNIVLWFLWLGRTTESLLPLYFSTFIIILNFTLSQFSYGREKLASYILVGFAFFVQALMIILLYNIISLQK